MIRALPLALSFIVVLGVDTQCFADQKGDLDAATLFKSVCAPCHGVAGNGDGPVSGALKLKMQPLSGLSKRHGGEFPAEYVRKLVDGRSVIDAHGSRTMPVWGDYFALMHRAERAAPSPAATEANNAMIINALVEYISSLQKK